MIPQLLLPFLLAATPQAGNLRQDFEEVSVLLATEDGAGSHQRILKILEDHEGELELLKHLPTLQDALIESLFLLKLQENKTGTSGDAPPEIPFRASILSYKEKTGKIKLRWEGDQLEDFSVDGEGAMRIPLDLSGRFRLGLSLDPYPEEDQIRILIDSSDGRRFEIDCGADHPGMSRQVAKAYQVVDARFEMLDREDKKLPKPGVAMDLDVKSTGSAVQVLFNRKKILSLKTGRGPIGFITFEGIDPEALIAVEYEGPLAVETMADQIALHRGRQRMAFRQGLDMTTILPEWTHAYLTPTTYGLEGVVPPGGEPSEEHQEAWAIAQSIVRDVRTNAFPIQGLSYLQDEALPGLPQILREYASLRVAYEGGYWEFAMGHARNVLKEDPNHTPTRNLQLEVTARHGDGDRAWELAKQSFQRKPKDPTPILQASLLLMRLDMVDDLIYFLEDDEELPKAIKKRCLDLITHRTDPAAGGLRTYEQNRLTVYSDLPRDRAEAVGGFLAREVSRALGFLPEDTLDGDDDLRLILFADRWDYDEFAAEVVGMGHPSASGFYCAEYDAVVAWDYPHEEELQESLRREMLIHLGKRMHAEYPVWACIGLAELVADGRIQPGKEIRELSPRAISLYQTSQREGLIPFGHMLHMSDQVFYTLEGERSMECQAWLACVMLMVMTEDVEFDLMAIFDDGMRSGRTWAEVVDYLFEIMDSGNYLDRIYGFVVDGLGRLAK